MPKTKSTGPEVRLQSIRDAIAERQDLAIEAAQCGVFAYGYGGCSATVLGAALMAALETPEETAQAICERLDGFELTEAQFEDVLRHCFFLYGVYKSFLAKTEGKYKGGHNVK